MPIDRAVRVASGGNQQKIVVAGARLHRPRKNALRPPSSPRSPRAASILRAERLDIHARLREAAANVGAGVLVLCRRIWPNWCALCNRILKARALGASSPICSPPPPTPNLVVACSARRAQPREFGEVW
jgi:ABC-type sugar transport system ATPase subunit